MSEDKADSIAILSSDLSSFLEINEDEFEFKEVDAANESFIVFK